MTFAILGRTKRNDFLKKMLLEDANEATIIENTEYLPECFDADCVICPIPTTSKDGKLNLSGKNTYTLDDILKKCKTDAIVITCGAVSTSENVYDLNKREDFAYLNAIPTAEGAICIAISNSDVSMHYNRILITGFGRVAKILADRLNGLCPSITIAARSDKDIFLAKALGFQCIKTDELKRHINEFDIIFQTIPSRFLDESTLKSADGHQTIIELSSKSIGTDEAAANSLGIRLIHAPALPERFAPATAGMILYKTVKSILKEHNKRQRGAKL